MNDQDQIIEQINQGMALLKVDFRIERVVRLSYNTALIFVTYEGEDKRQYELRCSRGLALKRIDPGAR